ACGADYSVRIVLDRSKVSVGESVRMIVRVSGVRGRSPVPVVAGLEPFEVRRTGTSSSVRISNGKVDSSVEFGYMLEPKGPGAFRIGPARVTLDGHTYRSGSGPGPA
ncbi:MAG: BatD family protein, partial [Deltaproteobacteria bacterium]|nr:BatD family protein [Deltaproteobacteria bacterium]